MSTQHGLVPAAAIQGLARLLRLEHEATASIQVNKTVIIRPIRLRHDNAPFEDIGIVSFFFTGRIGLRQFQQGTQFGQEQLIIGPFAATR